MAQSFQLPCSWVIRYYESNREYHQAQVTGNSNTVHSLLSARIDGDHIGEIQQRDLITAIRRAEAHSLVNSRNSRAVIARLRQNLRVQLKGENFDESLSDADRQCRKKTIRQIVEPLVASLNLEIIDISERWVIKH
jgi:hypothetical protein